MESQKYHCFSVLEKQKKMYVTFIQRSSAFIILKCKNLDAKGYLRELIHTPNASYLLKVKKDKRKSNSF